jgi:hypothetical protein
VAAVQQFYKSTPAGQCAVAFCTFVRRDPGDPARHRPAPHQVQRRYYGRLARFTQLRKTVRDSHWTGASSPDIAWRRLQP